MIVIIDGSTIEHSLYEISSFEVSALSTARLLSSLSFVIYFFSLCFIVFILIIDGRIIEYGTLILDLPGNKLCICEVTVLCTARLTTHSYLIITFISSLLFYAILYDCNNRRENNRAQSL